MEFHILSSIILKRQQQQHTHLPRCVGFGIRNSEQVCRLASYCDGVIIGSAIVQIINISEETNKRELDALTYLFILYCPGTKVRTCKTVCFTIVLC